MRLINADALREELLWCKEQSGAYDDHWKDVIERLDAQPTIGGWIRVNECSSCRHWDRKSGLSARMCKQFNGFTTQHEFCSRWKPKEEEWMITAIECPCTKCDLRKWYARTFDMHIYGEDCFFECEEYDEYKQLKNECKQEED